MASFGRVLMAVSAGCGGRYRPVFGAFLVAFAYNASLATELELSPLHVHILMELWKDHKHGSKKGLTRKELATRLVQNPDSQLVRPFTSTDQITEYLTELANAVALVRVTRERDGQHLKLAQETAVTLPTTAQILLLVHDAELQHIERAALIDAVLALRLKHSERAGELTRADVEEKIEWAARRTTSKRGGGHYIQKAGTCLAGRNRLNNELHFIRRLAAELATAQDAETPAPAPSLALIEAKHNVR